MCLTVVTDQMDHYGYEFFVFVVFYVGSGGNNHAVDYYKETSYP